MTTYTLHDLAATIRARATESGDASYTRKLLDQGIQHCAKKFGEEAVEAVIAAVGQDDPRLLSECADVLYHLMVMLEARGLTLAQVEAVLASRTAMSGLEEKAARANKSKA